MIFPEVDAHPSANLRDPQLTNGDECPHWSPHRLNTNIPLKQSSQNPSVAGMMRGPQVANSLGVSGEAGLREKSTWRGECPTGTIYRRIGQLREGAIKAMKSSMQRATLPFSDPGVVWRNELTRDPAVKTTRRRQSEASSERSTIPRAYRFR